MASVERKCDEKEKHYHQHECLFSKGKVKLRKDEIGHILKNALHSFPKIMSPMICHNVKDKHQKTFENQCHAMCLSGKKIMHCQRRVLEVPRNMRYPGDFVYIACPFHFRKTLLVISKLKRVVKEYIRENVYLELYNEIHHCILLLLLHIRKVEFAIFYSRELLEDKGHIVARELDEHLLIQYQEFHQQKMIPKIDEDFIHSLLYKTKYGGEDDEDCDDDCDAEDSDAEDRDDDDSDADCDDSKSSSTCKRDEEEDFDMIIAQFANPSGNEYPIEELPSGFDTRIANIILQRFIQSNSLLYSLKPEHGDDKEVLDILDICSGFSKKGKTVQWIFSKCYPNLILLTRAHIARTYLITESSSIYIHLKELESLSNKNIDEYVITVYFMMDKIIRKAMTVKCDDSQQIYCWLADISICISSSTTVGEIDKTTNYLESLKIFQKRLMTPSYIYEPDFDFLKNILLTFTNKIIALQEILERLIRKNIEDTPLLKDFYNDHPHFESRKLILTIFRYIGLSNDTSELYLMAKEYQSLYINEELISTKCLIALLICEAHKHVDTEKRNLPEILKHTLYQCPMYRTFDSEVQEKKIIFLWERVKSHEILKRIVITLKKEKTKMTYLNFIISMIYFTIIPSESSIMEESSRNNFLKLNAIEKNAIVYNFVEHICTWKDKGEELRNALLSFVLFVYECGKQCNIPGETLKEFLTIIRKY